jgi:hypothetical protein
MTSVLNVDTIADKAGTGPVGLTKQTAPKSYIRYSGSANTINSSFNFSSLTDHGAGDHTVTLASAMSDADYATAGQAGYGNSNLANVAIPNSDHPVTSSTFRCQTFYVNPTKVDMGYVNMSTLGDLA